MVRLVKSLPAHSDKAWDVAVHPTLPLLASGSTDKTCCVYSLKPGFPLLSRLEDAHKRSVRSVAFKPPMRGIDYVDLPALAAGSFDSTISIWGIDEPDFDEIEDDDNADEENQNRTDKEIRVICQPGNEWNLMALIEGHENEVKSVAWNHSGNLLASCSRDKTVWIWETDPETLEEFECIAVLSDHDQDIKHVCWHPSKNLLASSSYDDTIRIYQEDDDEWSCVGILNGHQGTVWCSVFEPTGDNAFLRLASASDDATVRIWTTGMVHTDVKGDGIPLSIKQSHEMVWEQELVLPKAHTMAIYSVAWSKSGRLASVGSDGRLVIYSKKGSAKEDTENASSATEKDEWIIDSIKETTHGVYEVNSVVWADVDGQEHVITAGDDGKVNVWAV